MVVVLGRTSTTAAAGGGGAGRLGTSIIKVAKRADAYDTGESSLAVHGYGGVCNLGVAVPEVGGNPGNDDLGNCSHGASILKVSEGRHSRRRRCRAERRSRRRSGCRLVWKIRGGINRGRTGKPCGRGHGRRSGRRGRRRGRGGAAKGGGEGRAETWHPAAAVAAQSTEGAQEPLDGAALRAHRLGPPLRRSLGPAQRPREATLRPLGQTAAAAATVPSVSVGCSPGCPSEAYFSSSSFKRCSSESSWSSANCFSENCSSKAPCSSRRARRSSARGSASSSEARSSASGSSASSGASSSSARGRGPKVHGATFETGVQRADVENTVRRSIA